MDKKVIFIVGPPRTGTTYLLLLLMEHKLIVNPFGDPYESNLFDKVKMDEAIKRFNNVEVDLPAIPHSSGVGQGQT